MSVTPTRVNPFADVDDLPNFAPKRREAKPVVLEHIEQIAETNDFPSRQAPSAQPRAHSARRWKTGRNQQINIKATPQVIERLYRLADARRVPLGELLDLALRALEGASSAMGPARQNPLMGASPDVSGGTDSLDRLGHQE